MIIPPRVIEQRNTPVCSACAIVTAVESQLPDFRGSYGFVYTNTEGKDRWGAVSIESALASSARYGICSERRFPSNGYGQKPSLNAYEEARAVRTGVSLRVRKLEDMLIWCDKGVPLVVSYKPALLVSLGLRVPRVESWQLHASVILGYEVSRGAMRVRNSWGPNWGENGDFWLPMSQIASIRSCYTVTL